MAWVTTAISSHVATYPDSMSGVMRAWIVVRKAPLLISNILPRSGTHSEGQVILLFAFCQ